MTRSNLISIVIGCVCGLMLNVVVGHPLEAWLHKPLPRVGDYVPDGDLLVVVTPPTCSDRNKAISSERTCEVEVLVENEGKTAVVASAAALLVASGHGYPPSSDDGRAFERAISPERSRSGSLAFSMPRTAVPELVMIDADADGGYVTIDLRPWRTAETCSGKPP